MVDFGKKGQNVEYNTDYKTELINYEMIREI